MMFYFQSGQLGHSTNTIILKSNEHKSYAWVFSVICTFQSGKFFERLSMHSGVVYHIRASALTPQLIAVRHRITDSTHAPPVGNGIGEPRWVSERITNKRKILRRSGEGVKGRCLP